MLGTIAQDAEGKVSAGRPSSNEILQDTCRSQFNHLPAKTCRAWALQELHRLSATGGTTGSGNSVIIHSGTDVE